MIIFREYTILISVTNILNVAILMGENVHKNFHFRRQAFKKKIQHISALFQNGLMYANPMKLLCVDHT